MVESKGISGLSGSPKAVSAKHLRLAKLTLVCMSVSNIYRSELNLERGREGERTYAKPSHHQAVSVDGFVFFAGHSVLAQFRHSNDI